MLALNSMNRSINQAADELGRVHAELHRDIIRRGAIQRQAGQPSLQGLHSAGFLSH
jgi:hypothetical protein